MSTELIRLSHIIITCCTCQTRWKQNKKYHIHIRWQSSVKPWLGCCIHACSSPQVRESGIRNPESRKKLMLESGIQRLQSGIQRLESGIQRLESGIQRLESGIQATGIRKSTMAWNPESTIVWNPESTVVWNPESIEIEDSWNPESRDWDPESGPLMDSLTWGDAR